MAVRKYIQGQAISYDDRPPGCNIRFECDILAELPEGTEIIDDDTAYVENPNALFRRVAGAWVQTASFTGTIPSGLIAMWHGLLANIPAGWVLCDGQNGTPDLRDKFVKGAAAAAEPGTVGGSATHTHADHPALSHTGTAVANHPALSHTGAAVADHPALSHSGAAVADHPSHNHQYTDVPNHTHPHNMQGGTTGSTTGTNVMGSTATGGSARAMAIATSNPTGGVATGTTQGPNAVLAHSVTQPAQHAAQAHSVTQPDQHAAQAHSVTQPDQHAAQAHAQANNEPPYYAVAYIMKT